MLSFGNHSNNNIPLSILEETASSSVSSKRRASAHRSIGVLLPHNFMVPFSLFPLRNLLLFLSTPHSTLWLRKGSSRLQ